MPRRVLALALAMATLAGGCAGCDEANETPIESADTPKSDWEPALDIVDALPSCDIRHRGILLDVGSPAMIGRWGSSVDGPEGVVDAEHDGATWAKIYERSVWIDFYLPQVAPLFVSMRALAGDASRVDIALDGFLLDVERLRRGEIKTVTSRTTSLPVDAGLHQLQLRFRGRKRSDADPFAQIDWLRVGIPDDLDRTYGAPTLDSVILPSAQLGGVPHRSLTVPAPGTIACTLRIPPFAKLRTAIGMRGAGKGTATIALRRDGGPAEALKRIDVEGGDVATWTDIELPLHDYALETVTLEMTAVESSGTGRVMFGDPAVFVPTAPAVETSPAQSVVVVVLDGVEKSDLPPWRSAESPHLPNLRRAAERWTLFENHRAPSSLVPSAIASIVTGLSPREHSLADPGARLPDSNPQIGGMLSAASVRGAMFTAVPTSFGFFGFGSSWERFETYPPNGGAVASEPIADAIEFLVASASEEEPRPTAAILHLRGGHPPWEVTPNEAAKLPPRDYSGGITPRKAAQQLAATGGRFTRLSEMDEERIDALFHASLSRQDRALGDMVRRLEDAGLWEQTLFIVTGDVSSARDTFFADGADLRERLLDLPLMVHFPEGRHAGVRVDRPTELMDITRTLLTALTVPAPPEVGGTDLGAIAAGRHDVQRLRIAYLDNSYSARWGDFVLHGTRGKPPDLCQLSVDPTCAWPRQHLFPAVRQAMMRKLSWSEENGRTPPERQPLTLDSEAAGMLKVWGLY